MSRLFTFFFILFSTTRFYLGIVLILYFFFYQFPVYGQKVGLVMSGGGAKGLAHIGVLKALEENDIPVDYIVGTSMGGVVGGFYAAGYTPKEIESIALSREFQDWVSGRIPEDYKYFYSKDDYNASWLKLRLVLDTGFHATLQKDLINDVPMNFALAEMLAQSSARANYNFDNLVVPFRCLAAEIFTQEQIIMKSGSLSTALRATLSVPFFFTPIKINNQYVYDGGVYNNFPVDIALKEFSPAIIIGSNVSSKTYKKYPYGEDDNLLNYSPLYLLLSKSDSTQIDGKGVYIQPNLERYNALDFRYVKEMIKAGYDETMRKMPVLKMKIRRRADKEFLFRKRRNLMLDKSEVKVNALKLSGLRKMQEKYVNKLFDLTDKPFNTTKLRKNYYKLATDDNFQVLFPEIIYDSSSAAYKMNLFLKRDKNVGLELGGNISSRSIHELFVGIRYNYLRRQLYNFQFDFYTGRFYQSAQFKIRTNFPVSFPFYIEPEINYNGWNYLETNELFIPDGNATVIRQSDERIGLNIGFAFTNKGKFVLNGSYINNLDSYNNTKKFISDDTLDLTQFEGQSYGLTYTMNTLNRKMYASKGQALEISFKIISGTEELTPGNTSIFEVNKKREVPRSWWKLKLHSEKYFFTNGTYHLSYLIEGVLSTQPYYQNFRSTQIASSAFYPLNDSKTLFLDRFRAFNYAAGGIRNVFTVKRNIDLRLEGYVFVPFNRIIEKSKQVTGIEEFKLSNVAIAGSFGAVYHTFLGPVSASLNYYNDNQKPFGVLFHIGYLLYHQRNFE